MSVWNGCFVIFLIISGAVYAEYKINLASLNKCNVTDSKMDKSVDLEYHMGVHKLNRKTTLIKANFTVGRKMGPIFITYKSYELKQSNAKDLGSITNKLSCKHPVVMSFMKMIKANINKDCYAMPGTYAVNDINVDDFVWLFTNVMVNPGRYTYELEIQTDKGIVACVSVTCDIVKKK